MLSRRGLIGALLATPIIIKTPGLLMPVKPLQQERILTLTNPRLEMPLIYSSMKIGDHVKFYDLNKQQYVVYIITGSVHDSFILREA